MRRAPFRCAMPGGLRSRGSCEQRANVGDRAGALAGSLDRVRACDRGCGGCRSDRVRRERGRGVERVGWSCARGRRSAQAAQPRHVAVGEREIDASAAGRTAAPPSGLGSGNGGACGRAWLVAYAGDAVRCPRIRQRAHHRPGAVWPGLDARHGLGERHGQRALGAVFVPKGARVHAALVVVRGTPFPRLHARAGRRRCRLGVLADRVDRDEWLSGAVAASAESISTANLTPPLLARRKASPRRGVVRGSYVGYRRFR